MIVLDASVVVEWLAGGDRMADVLPWIEAHERELHAPDLLDVEVVQVLRRLARGGVVGPARAGAAVEILCVLPVERHPTRPLLPRMWDLRENLTAYDATYVALAEGIGAPLLTMDGGIAAAPGLFARVLVPGRDALD